MPKRKGISIIRYAIINRDEMLDITKTATHEKSEWVEIKEFLEGAKEAQVKNITTTPTIERLRWLTTITRETALFLSDKWRVVKGSQDSVHIADMIPEEVQVILHSHLVHEMDKKGEGAFPSPRDIYNARSDAENLIVSEIGITQYEGVSGEVNKAIEKEAASSNPEYRRGNIEKYLRFLDAKGVRYKIYPWDDDAAQKTRQLLKGMGAEYERHLGNPITEQKFRALLGLGSGTQEY